MKLSFKGWICISKKKSMMDYVCVWLYDSESWFSINWFCKFDFEWKSVECKVVYDWMNSGNSELSNKLQSIPDMRTPSFKSYNYKS